MKRKRKINKNATTTPLIGLCKLVFLPSDICILRKYQLYKKNKVMDKSPKQYLNLIRKYY